MSKNITNQPGNNNLADKAHKLAPFEEEMQKQANQAGAELSGLNLTCAVDYYQWLQAHEQQKELAGDGDIIFAQQGF